MNLNNKLFMNHLTYLKPDEFVSQSSLIEDLFSNVRETQEIEKLKKSLQNMTYFGFNTIAVSHKDKYEGEMVCTCLDSLFKKTKKESISHIVHCSPTAIIGEEGGIIGGVGRYVLDNQSLKNVTYIPMLGGCASMQPVIEVASALAKYTNQAILVIFSLHPSSARKQIIKENLVESKLRASPFILFGDACVAFTISQQKDNIKYNSYELINSKFNYYSEQWVAKAFLQGELTMLLNGDVQKNMLKNYLLKELDLARSLFGVKYFFVHNQVPKFFKESIVALNISEKIAPEIVSKYGNLAFVTSFINLCENERIIKDKSVIGLFSAGEHSGVSESTLVFKFFESEDSIFQKDILSMKKSKSTLN